ncbi:GNAT family N-acetyltransferase [Aureivirga sp. CE67]|uniref:GNAT family N-acetyltransferase n=1 Tax=Aureivirga sp. CE67 TaxID=1788983 RepID=UPI0018C8E830|nr:GNAT family N-acetyltransferase [Aureivirga sp. CE67]
MNLIVKEITTEDTYPLRKNVLRENIPLSFQFAEDNLETTSHFGVFEEEKLIGIVTFIQKENEYFKNQEAVFQLRAMAVDKAYQGKGVGKLFLGETLKLAKEKNIRKIWLNAREIAVPFYKSLGFSVVGDVFDVKFVGNHFRMVQEQDKFK